jgi:hypothetical protein
VSQQPPPPYGGTPPGEWGPPAPWGGPPPPKPPGGLPVWGQVLAGAGIGLFAGVVLMVLVVVVAASAQQDSSDELSGATLFWLAVLVPLAFPVPLLFFRHTRMWAVGLIIGTALSTISLAGACAWIITGLSSGGSV